MHVEAYGTTFTIDESLVAESPAEIRRQVREYERGERREFDLTVTPPDDFTGAVMEAMAAIPRGETRTYGDLAAELDSAAVAVGQACGRNPVPIVVPCHRVVGADSLGGFSNESDDPVGVKRRLLDQEGAIDEE
ncbi:methylated-DNA--[protein]-cysteine S-methyltransferase [Halobacteriaceae archaeon GCM10025711]